jgi:hypothetical protein
MKSSTHEAFMLLFHLLPHKELERRASVDGANEGARRKINRRRLPQRDRGLRRKNNHFRGERQWLQGDRRSGRNKAAQTRDSNPGRQRPQKSARAPERRSAGRMAALKLEADRIKKKEAG